MGLGPARRTSATTSACINRAAARASPALQEFANLDFYNAWNDNILYYGKATPDQGDFLLFAVNLDPHNPQGAHFEVPLWEFGLPRRRLDRGRGPA